jgi:mannose-6-phosphate isomerase-like protein (cupin superfamily)
VAEVVLRLGDGEIVAAQAQREVLILAESEGVTITWSRYGPGEPGPGPHVHREHTDAFYVLEGEVSFVVGPEGDTVRLGAGGFAAVPANVVHSFVNEGSGEARWLNFHAPDTGFAAYLRALRDGRDASFFDTFDPPADGGLPAAEVLVAGPGAGVKAALPELWVAEGEPDGAPRGARYTFRHPRDGEDRVVSVLAPA